MAGDQRKENQRQDPKGFTPRSGGLASEYAREQGWDTNEEQRVQTPREKQPYDGGRDFGNTAEDTGSAVPDDAKRPPDSRE